MSSTQFDCLLQCGKPCKASDSTNNMAKEAWTKLKYKSLNWKGCDTFGNVHDTVDWELGPSGKYLHANCRLDISSSVKLNRSKLRQQKRESESAPVSMTRILYPPLHQSVSDQARVLFMTKICVCGV